MASTERLAGALSKALAEPDEYVRRGWITGLTLASARATCQLVALPGWPAHLTPAETSALAEFVPAARRALGAELFEIRLFGSRARGEGSDDSDLDVALVVSAAGRRRRYDVYDLAFDIGLQHDVALAPLVIDRAHLDDLRGRELLFPRELDREGIVL